MSDKQSRALAVSMHLLRWVLILLTLGLALLVFVDGPISSLVKEPYVTPTRWALAGLALIVFVGALLIGRSVKRSKRITASPMEDEPVPAELFVQTTQRVASRGYAPDTMDFFEEFLVAPEHYLVRVIESVDLGEQALRVTVSLNLSIPELAQSEKPVVRLLPLARIRKGVLLDTLEISDSGGKHLSALPYLETRALLVLLVDSLVRRAFLDNSGKVMANDSEWTTAVRNAWDYANEVVAGSSQNASGLDGIRKELQAAKEEWEASGRIVNSGVLKRLEGVCDFLDGFYILVVEPRLDGRPTITYSRDLPLFNQTESLIDRMRVILGLSPSRFTVPLSWPFLTGTYHFRIAGEAGLYITDHSLLHLEKKEPITASLLGDQSILQGSRRGSAMPFMSTAGTSGLPSGHLYLRNFNGLKRFGMATVVSFEEVPPGVLGGAAAVSAVSSSLVLFFACLGTGRTFGSSLPAFLLALPAFVASWLGVTSDNHRLVRTSLTARAGLIGVGLVSLMSALLFTAQSLGIGIITAANVDISLLGEVVHLRSVSWWWLALAGFSVALSFHLARVVIRRTIRYYRCLKYWSTAENVEREFHLGVRR